MPTGNCAECNTTTTKVCGACKQVFYCKRECQVKAWKAGHNKFCGKVVEAAPKIDLNTELFPADEGKGNDRFKTYDNDSVIGIKAPSLDSLDFLENGDAPRPVAGKPYIVLLWAQYHKPGYPFIANYSKIFEKYGDKIGMVAVSLDPNNIGPNKFIKDPAGKYSSVFPTKMSVAHDAGKKFKTALSDGLRAALSPPHSFLIDGEGTVVWHQDHSELGATTPKYLHLLDSQLKSFVETGKVQSVGDRAIVEDDSDDDSDDMGEVELGDDEDGDDPFAFM